jgi:hypothetical protein
MNTVDTYPAESRLLIESVISLLDKPDRLKDIGDVIESSNFGFELLGLFSC